MSDKKTRCQWCLGHPLMTEYHDTEWGVPLHDDQRLYEFLVLDAAQAGLSWRTVLLKRENYRKAFHGFDAKRIVRYTQKDVTRLLNDPGIIRNKLKVNSAIVNARSFLAVREGFGSFDRYIWQFVGGRPIVNRFRRMSHLPAKTKESDAMSKDMIQRGFKFVGSTICYAFMQASGMVNDHTIDCFRHKQVQKT